MILGIKQNIHSGYDVKAWEELWLSTTPARPARPNVLVAHPRMTVSDFINGESKEWDVAMLKNFVAPEDILLI